MEDALLGPLKRADLSHWASGLDWLVLSTGQAEYVSPIPGREDRNRSSFRSIMFFRMHDYGYSPKTRNSYHCTPFKESPYLFTCLLIYT
jgi:hypothetical protein